MLSMPLVTAPADPGLRSVAHVAVEASTATCATERSPGSAGAVTSGIDSIPDPTGHLPLWQAGHLGNHARRRDDGDRVEIARQALAVNPDLVRNHQVQVF